MVLLFILVLKTLQINIQIKAQQIEGMKNNVAGAIYRFEWPGFRQLAPSAD